MCRLQRHRRTVRHAGRFEDNQFVRGKRFAYLHLVRLDGVAEGALGQPYACGRMAVEHQDDGMQSRRLQRGGEKKRGVEAGSQFVLDDSRRPPDLLPSALETRR